MTDPVQPLHCPAALRALPGWLVWRYAPNPVAGKPPLKLPCYADEAGGPRQGRQGSEQDRARLVSFDAALARAREPGFEGVGLALLPEFGVAALDFDHCVAGGQVAPEVEQLVAGTYAELSPSGHGVRAFVRAAPDVLGNHKSPAAAGVWGFETFSSSGFVTFTGRQLPASALVAGPDYVAPVGQGVRDLAAARFHLPGRQAGAPGAAADDFLMLHEPPVGLLPAQIDEALAALDPDCGYEQWLQLGMAIHHETAGEGFDHWDAWSARGGKYPGRERLLARWAGFGKEDCRPVTARYLLKTARAAGAKVDLRAAAGERLLEAGSYEKNSSEALNGGASGAGKAARPQAKAPRFVVEPASEFANGPAPQWVIKGVLPRAELAVLYGESGAGKSFVALDLAMSIARGVDWRGCRTQAGRVVYVAAEGGGGFRSRLKAYSQHHGVALQGLPFGVVHAAPNLLLRPDAADLARAILDSGGADVVVLDTFAQVTPGANENSAEDVGQALAHCKGIHRATGAVVVLVHHSGKDASKGARGWSGLRAAADCELEVLRTGAGRWVRLSKMKDGQDEGAWGFDLLPVPVGLDEDGQALQSCAVVEAPVPVAQGAGRARPLGKWEALLAQVVGEMALAQSSGIEVQAVLDEALRRAPAPEAGKRDTRKQLAKRALQSLCEGDDAPYWLDPETGCLELL